MAEPVLRASGLVRAYGTGKRRVVACDGVDLDLVPGELLVVRGRSGAGKTTLLNLVGGLQRPDAGSVRLAGVDLATAPEAELVRLRRTRLGFVFQGFALLAALSAAENVEVPLRLLRVDPAERDRRVAAMLEAVGLSEHARQRPGELSGGQQQRVGVARALVAEPDVLLADEPTGQLDSATGALVMDLVLRLVRQRGVAAMVTTHDPALIARADRVLELHDGRLRSPS